MMESIISNITGKWCEDGIIKKSDIDIYEYGLEMFIYTILNLLVVLGLAALAGKLIEALAMLLVVLPLQSFGGGFHAKTHFRCFLIMFIGWWSLC